MEAFLSDEELDDALIKSAIRQAVINGDIVPVIGGSAFKNKGVQCLLDAVAAYLPSPIDVWSVTGEDPKTGQAVERQVGDDQPLAGLAFKVMTDSYVGKLIFVRVYSGKLKKGATIYNPRTGKTERIGRLLHMHANSREDTDCVYSGDIAAAVGLKQVTTGDTLCERSRAVALESMTFPEPVISIAIEPKTSADRDKLFDSIGRLSEEDPTFRMRTDVETGQTIISGMGELHLEIIQDRLLREFKVGASCGKPQVAYREAILGPADGESKFVKQTGGHGQYGHVILKIEPRPQGHGLTIENKVKGGNIPAEFIKPVEQGIEEAAGTGILAGYPIVDLHVDILDGSHHEVDSSEIAFKFAGSMAFRDAAKKAGLQLLEPIMQLEICTPEEHVGDIIGDLSSRRGAVENIDVTGEFAQVNAKAPLANLFGYATAIRSLSRGRASHSMEPTRFDPVPEAVQSEILDVLY
jgi:elongation factor G